MDLNFAGNNRNIIGKGLYTRYKLVYSSCRMILIVETAQHDYNMVDWVVKPEFSQSISRPIWAAAWQNQRNDLCAQRRLKSAWASAQSDQSLHCQPWHLPSLIRVFAVRMKKHWALKFLLSTQWRLKTFFVEIWSWKKFYDHSLPSADSRKAVVSYWRKNEH